MAHLSELQIEKIKEHMLHEEAALKIKFKAKNTLFDKKRCFTQKWKLMKTWGGLLMLL